MLLVVAFVGTAMAGGEREVPWYRDPGSAVTLKSSGFVFKARLPRGWSVTDGAVVPPEAFASACHVRGEFYRNREWNRFLVSALDLGDVVHASRQQRVLRRIGGPSAGSSPDTSGVAYAVNGYINLFAEEPHNAFLLRFPGAQTQAWHEC